MARKKSISTEQKLFEQYEHKDKKRINNPPVGLVDAHTDNGGLKKKTYQYDPLAPTATGGEQRTKA